MVFGFSRKERRVPDLSRYDYYYQNQPDYNKSHRLSAAAASAAAGEGMSRSQSMVYTSTPVSYSQSIHSPPPSNSRNSTMGSRMRKSSSQYLQPNRNSNYKTYSLRSQSSYENINDRRHSNVAAPGTRVSSSPVASTPTQRKPRVKKTVNSYTAPSSRRTSVRIDNSNNTTTAPKPTRKTVVKKKIINNNTTHNNNNIPSRSISNPTPVKTQKRVNSLTSNRPSHTTTTATTGNNSRLNSITSNGTARRLKKTSSNNNGQSSRTNSITTKVTRVTDPQGRTTSITKKTIKRIDGYEYIETTTTTTNLVPLDENENEHTLDPQSQRHFDEFSDNFNMTEDEDHESLLLGSPNKEIYQDNLYDHEFIDNHIDDTLNNGHLQEIDDTLSIPNEIEEEKDINLMEENVEDNNSVEQEEEVKEIEPEQNQDTEFGFENQLLDDVVEEDEEELQEEEVVSEPIQNIEEEHKEQPEPIPEAEEEFVLEKEEPASEQDEVHALEVEEEIESEEYDENDHENTLNMIDQIKLRDSSNNPPHVEEKHPQIDNIHLSPQTDNHQQFAHPYATGLIPLDEASSVSKFSDAMESVPSSSENLLQQPKQKSKQKPQQKQKQNAKKKSKPQVRQPEPEPEPELEPEPQYEPELEYQQEYEYEPESEFEYEREPVQPVVAGKTPVVKKTLKKKVTIDHRSLTSEENRPRRTVKRQVKTVVQTPPQPKKPLTEQEMYLKALEVAKKKVYNNGYDAGRTDYVGPKDTRSTMGSRMTLRDQSIPKESVVSHQNNMLHYYNNNNNNSTSHHMGFNMMHNKESSSPQKHNSKRFGGSFFSKHKHESTKPVISSPLPLPSVTPVVNPVAEQTSISSSQFSQPIKPRMSKEIASTLSSTRSEQENKLADEHMYAKALEIAQKRFNDAHQKSLQQQEQEQLAAAKEREELMRSKLENSIEQYNTTSTGSLDKPPSRFTDNTSSLNQSLSHHSPAVNSTATFNSNQSTRNTPTAPNMTQFEEMPTTYENSQQNITTEQPSTIVQDGHNEYAKAQTPENDVQSGGLLTASPQEPFEPSNIKKMPTLESITSSKKKKMFSRRPSIDVEKNKSKFRNMFDKVVQFSNENSGYQPTKKEKIKLEEEKRLAEQIERENEENIYEQQMHPPPLERGPSVSHGAATTLPVQQSLNHFPKGLNPTGSVSSFQRQRSEARQGTSNDNMTNSSSIFSHSKKHTVDSITPTDEIGHQQVQQQTTSTTTNVQTNAGDITTTTIDSKQQFDKASTHSSSKKNKPKFFSKIFKRSKQAN